MKARVFFQLAAMMVAPGVALCAGDGDEGRVLEPPRIIRTTPVNVPEGPEAPDDPWNEVEVVINVDADGQLVDLLVTRATTHPHARAAEQALREWRYEPARENGRRVGVRQRVVFFFERQGVALASDGNLRMMRRFDHLADAGGIERLSAGKDLDAPPRVLESVSPRPIPVEEPVQVLLDFIVDETGRPRMPVVVSAASELHAASAVMALEQWRFAPPTRHGRPVAVRVQQEFRFEPKSS